jgi:hypothetical protein
MGNDPAYFRKWYDDNKEALSVKRKKQYEDDPEYREAALQRSAEYREQMREFSQDGKVPRHHIPKRYATGDGGELLLFSVGSFALFVGRSVQSLSHWESAGILPRTPYRSGSRGFRFYTTDMMVIVKEEIGNKKRLFPAPEGMFDRIRERWRALGVPVDCEEGLEEALRQTTTQ